MRKILTILLFIIGLQAFSQVDNRFRYNWIYSQEFSGGIVLPNLSNGTDTIFLVVNNATGTIDTIGITELRTIFSEGGATPTLQQVLDQDSNSTTGIKIPNIFIGNPLSYNGANQNKYSILMGGSGATALGDYSTSIGIGSQSDGYVSFAYGDYARAQGDYSVAIGRSIVSPGRGEISLGIYNTEYTPTSTLHTDPISPTDRLFSIGNGSNPLDRNNAISMLYNGTTTIDTTWSYGSKMTGYSFSGLQIPHTEYVNKNIITSGTTANRPSSPATGELYFDTTISPARVIIYNGTAWVNVDGTAL